MDTLYKDGEYSARHLQRHCTRAQRFLEIRDEIMARFNPKRHHLQASAGQRPEFAPYYLRCGPFRIAIFPYGTDPNGKFGSLSIWPDGKVDCGRVVFGNKVANVSWDANDNVEIMSYRSGAWESELLALLRAEGGVLPFG